jgi:hypothetical protein
VLHVSDTLKWNKGQPLGLYPSFAAFSLWHGAILRSLEIGLGVNDKFRIVGDDVVITDGALYHKYRTYLDKYKVPVSEGKTFVKTNGAEFLGRVYTKNGPYHPEKVIHPTAGNKFMRLFRAINASTDLNSPEAIASYALNLLNTNQGLGLTLKERAAILRLYVDNNSEARIFQLKASRDEYNKLSKAFSVYFESFGNKVKSRSQLTKWISDCTSMYPIIPQNYTTESPVVQTVEILAKRCGLTEISLFNEIALTSGDWGSFCKTSSECFYEKVPMPLRFFLKRALQKQLKDFKKSQMIVEHELLEYMIKILEQPELF